MLIESDELLKGTEILRADVDSPSISISHFSILLFY